MALQLSIPVRNAMLDAIQTIAGTSAKLMFYTGSPPANCATATSGAKIVEFDLASNWASAASGGSKTLTGLPFSVNAVAGGTLGYFRLFAADGVTCAMQGTITATGGGGDLTVDNTSVANGQNINVTGFTLNAPGA
jgi:hypothetical protein